MQSSNSREMLSLCFSVAEFVTMAGGRWRERERERERERGSLVVLLQRRATGCPCRLQSCTGHGKVGVKIWEDGRTAAGRADKKPGKKLAEEASEIAACPLASPANAPSREPEERHSFGFALFGYTKALFSSQKFCKIFQIPHHIESLNTCIKY